MPLDSAEGINAALQGLGIGQEIIAKVQALGENPGAEAYARALGASEDGAQMRLAKLIDQVRADIAD